VLRFVARLGCVVGKARVVMIENVDGTITVTPEEVFAAAGLNERLAELGIRATAFRADPSCSSAIAEVVSRDLYPRIVIQNHPAPGVTIEPEAIPVGHTLLLAAQRAPDRSRLPAILVRTMLVSGPAPACIGEFLVRPSPLAHFTAAGREVVSQARQEAFDLRHPNVEPVHILLALLRRTDNVAGQARSSRDVTFEHVRAQAVRTVELAQPLVQRSTARTAPFTPPAMAVLERARVEASELGNAMVEPEHILLGLVSDPESPVVRMLRESAVDPGRVRAAVLRLRDSADPDGDDADR
jgi:hypothetical protein